MTKLLPDPSKSALIASHFYFQSLYLCSHGRFFDLTFAQSFNDRINIINSIPYANSKILKDVIRLLKFELNSFLGDDKQTVAIKLDACHFFKSEYTN